MATGVYSEVGSDGEAFSGRSQGKAGHMYWGAPRRQPWPTSCSQALGEPRRRAGCLVDQAALLLWSKMELELWFLFLPRNGS